MDDDVTDVPDVLGEGWTARTIPLRPDDRSRTGTDPVATLVSPAGTLRPDGERRERAVLYVHGFVDYFFHPHVAAALAEHGYDLHGLDLRDYGRSIREGRIPNSIRDLAVYAEEVDAAVRLLRERYGSVSLLGHSTGGLVAALWANGRPGAVDAVVLNSPWLELRGSWFERKPLTLALRAVGRVTPDLVVGHIAPHYGRALHAATGGEWDFDLAWKPHEGFPARAAFIRAVRAGQARVRRGLDIGCPVLVLASDASGPDDREHDALLTTDSVLDVADIRRLTPRLGRDVSFVEVPGGAHDLALSPSPARERYLREVVTFLDRVTSTAAAGQDGGSRPA
ncbi:alpha/beta hydrolase [Cellulomonas fimi]|uniref:Alpha/beta hydrolase fold protein n=1 Tax=Cellulomonas fimi (strain ATCC 484 / DSM 20113 / JCM 1341 / CCUG 24087 / LMG 16345 / NBRC 15513 / NCIMB 8980 / NCTC 7547 / NRS-133) TaxID=590998 RepID=F4H331_CELFA|nr:alpha/beta hydrolase [Cellulomonas fimi]AEE47649.1 alpha/beta hydrolase fold protein [Cellulomonas fimi ATCC 484]NNH09028.1 alpha/beta hydrolase [Cellulomonas fimi]VEH36719.1 acetoin dehydrogenase E2 subunit dihydrolipoyllysine-residue acetyltransferase [Cellulomonas fimi]